MNWAFSLRHWLITLIAGSFVIEVIDYLASTNVRPFDEFFSLFLTVLIFSFVFSIPTFVVYAGINF